MSKVDACKGCVVGFKDTICGYCKVKFCNHCSNNQSCCICGDIFCDKCNLTEEVTDKCYTCYGTFCYKHFTKRSTPEGNWSDALCIFCSNDDLTKSLSKLLETAITPENITATIKKTEN